MSYSGLILSDKKGETCYISFLTDDELEISEVKTNKEIVDLIEEFKPSFVAVNVGTKESRDEFTEEEQELLEEGYNFTPNYQQVMKVRRLELLQRQVLDRLGDSGPEFIRFEPYITAEELTIHNDSALESLGIETGNIKSSKAFDSVLGAVTSRFYSQGQFEEKGVIIPENL